MQPSISRVEGALERVPHPGQCLALLTPGTGLFSPQCSNLWLGTMLEQASGLLSFFPGSEGSWALSQDSGRLQGEQVIAWGVIFGGQNSVGRIGVWQLFGAHWRGLLVCLWLKAKNRQKSTMRI